MDVEDSATRTEGIPCCICIYVPAQELDEIWQAGGVDVQQDGRLIAGDAVDKHVVKVPALGIQKAGIYAPFLGRLYSCNVICNQTLQGGTK